MNPHVTPTSWDKVLESHLTCEQIQRLRQARVGIAGVGGLGSNCAIMLARSGIGELVLVDHDTVTLSNLNRQTYGPEHVGQPKVFALGQQLKQLRSDISVETIHKHLTGPMACEVFAHCQIVVEAVDDPTAKAELVNALLEAGHHVICASGMAGWGGEMQRRALGERCTVVGDFGLDVQAGLPPMAPKVILVAALQADEVLLRLLAPSSVSP